MGCNCGKPKCDGKCGISPAVLQINNPSECTLFHREEVPASMGDSKTNPPKNGAYKNVLLYYEADQTSWLYSSDGIPTKMVNGLTDYEAAINLPKINGETLIGDKSSADLKLADAPMVITIASGNTSWSGADTAEDIYNFFLNQGKVNVVFDGSDNYGYGIVSAAYIPGEQKMLCMTTVASVDSGSSPVEFSGNTLYGLMTFYTAGKAVDVGELDLQQKLFITDFTGLNMTDGHVLEGVPATVSSIGMVKPSDGLSISSDGTLTVIDHVFDTVAEMKASTELKNGDYAQTLGFYAVNDGGGATYYITNTGTANEMDVIAVGSLYANLVKPSVIMPEMLGAKGDNTTNDTASIQRAIDISSKVKLTKQYAVDYLTLHSNLELIGEDGASIRGNASHWLIYHQTDTTPIKNVTIKGIKITGYGVYTGSSMGEDTTKDAGIVIQYGNNITIDNCEISNFGEVAIRLDAITNAEVKNNRISSDLDYSSGGSIPNYSFGVQVDGDNIHVENNNIIGYIQGIINGAYTSNLFIENNLISQRHQHGIYLSSGSNILVKGNIINPQANAICGVKLQTNVLEHRIYNAVISDNLINSGQSDGAQGILVCSYNLAPYAIEKVIIANNKIYGNRGVEIENVIDLLIDSNIIATSNNSVSSYGIRIYNSTLANIPARITNVISNNNISAIQAVRTEYKNLGSEIRFSLNGNHIYVPLSSVVLTRTCVNIYQYADVLDIRNNYLESDVSDTPAANFSDGIYFGVDSCTKVILMANYSDGFRWGCRNANSFDADKIVNVGNAFNTELNITA